MSEQRKELITEQDKKGTLGPAVAVTLIEWFFGSLTAVTIIKEIKEPNIFGFVFGVVFAVIFLFNVYINMEAFQLSATVRRLEK